MAQYFTSTQSMEFLPLFGLLPYSTRCWPLSANHSITADISRQAGRMYPVSTPAISQNVNSTIPTINGVASTQLPLPLNCIRCAITMQCTKTNRSHPNLNPIAAYTSYSGAAATEAPLPLLYKTNYGFCVTALTGRRIRYL
jgi:hypothetical protein